MVKFQPWQFKVLRKVHKGLLCKCEGPFTIVKCVGKGAYKLKLPANLKIYLVFHVSRLKLYHEDVEDRSCRVRSMHLRPWSLRSTNKLSPS